MLDRQYFHAKVCKPTDILPFLHPATAMGTDQNPDSVVAVTGIAADYVSPGPLRGDIGRLNEIALNSPSVCGRYHFALPPSAQDKSPS